MSLKMYRQGDVLIREVTELPQDAKPVESVDRIVLAHGEATGHAHAIAGNEACEFTQQDVEAEVKRFLSVAFHATVTHEEHAPIELPPGFYQIVRQREYTPQAIRNVAD